MPVRAESVTGQTMARSCPQCGARYGSPLARYSLQPWRIVKCAECKFTYLENPPKTEELAGKFAWEKQVGAERQRRLAERPKLTWLDGKTRWRISLFPDDEPRWFPRFFLPGRVLDVGCGRGRWVPRNYVPFGIDISAERAREANQRMSARGGRAIQASAIDGLAQFPDRYFSGVVLRSYLEHETDPKPVLREVVRDGRRWRGLRSGAEFRQRKSHRHGTKVARFSLSRSRELFCARIAAPDGVRVRHALQIAQSGNAAIRR